MKLLAPLGPRPPPAQVPSPLQKPQMLGCHHHMPGWPDCSLQGLPGFEGG